jgi:uncharacterized membrane protein
LKATEVGIVQPDDYGDNTAMPWLVGALAAAGLVLATSFTAAFYRPSSPLARLVPVEWCGLGDGAGGCASVVRTPGARVFGPPNSLLGMVFYLAILGFAALGLPADLLPWFTVAAWATVAFGAYLGYRLLYVERMACTVCWTVHAINTVLALVLTAVLA